ncbi:MAG: hypothetical protein MPJ24_02310 [Pirellulaceae bacterium]|nr:hypothetical protein [Pirellulaceae bacterium]
MLTLFTTPKPFLGHIGRIQRNALKSWSQLSNDCQILLIGNEEGSAEVAQELGLEHLPEVSVNDYGTPLISSIFAKAQKHACHEILAYVNADILLMNDFIEVVQKVRAHAFLLIGQRIDFDYDQELFTDSPTWQTELLERAQAEGNYQKPAGMDYFVFTKGLYQNIPPYALGRFYWDNWLVYKAKKQRAKVIDVTESVKAIHQNHNYQHIFDYQNQNERHTYEASINSLWCPAGHWYSHYDASWKTVQSPEQRPSSLKLRRNWTSLAKPYIRTFRNFRRSLGHWREKERPTPSRPSQTAQGSPLNVNQEKVVTFSTKENSKQDRARVA